MTHPPEIFAEISQKHEFYMFFFFLFFCVGVGCRYRSGAPVHSQALSQVTQKIPMEKGEENIRIPNAIGCT